MRLCAFVLACVGASAAVLAQPASTTLSLRVDPGTGAVRALTPEERAELGDPFFERVLKDKADLITLTAVERALDPRPEELVVFVVDEKIVDPRPTHQPRAVIGFKSPPLARNVMLSVSFAPEAFPDNPRPFEVWGWDATRQRYNYYSLHNHPEGRRWVLDGASSDLVSETPPKGRCFRCHMNGAPVMKELFFPWNNWHSDLSGAPARYLTPLAPASDRWPVVADPHLNALADAARLETDVMLPSLRRFNEARISHGTAPDGTIDRRLLRPLFETTEFNLATSRTESGLHPLALSTPGPGQNVVIPNSFFLQADLIGGNPQLGVTGLGISQARTFSAVAKLSPSDYRRVLTDRRQVMRLTPPVPGDTQFSWLTPEPSFIDTNLVDQLLLKGLVTKGFVAAVLAVDLREPVFSARRAELFRALPNRLQTGEALSAQVAATLEAMSPSPGSPEAELLENLRQPDPVAHLGSLVSAYQVETAQAFGTESTRRTKVDALYRRLAARRTAVETHPTQRTLIESPLLFPTTGP